MSGNHESNGENGDIARFARCLPNRLPGLVGTYGRQWYVDQPATDPLVRVVMISPALDFGHGEWSYAKGTPHHAWLQAAVTEAIPIIYDGQPAPATAPRDPRAGGREQQEQQQQDASVQHGPQAEQQQQAREAGSC